MHSALLISSIIVEYHGGAVLYQWTVISDRVCCLLTYNWIIFSSNTVSEACSFVRRFGITDTAETVTLSRAAFPHNTEKCFSSKCLHIYSETQFSWHHQERGRYPNPSQRASYWPTLSGSNGGWGKSLAKVALDWSILVHTYTHCTFTLFHTSIDMHTCKLVE